VVIRITRKMILDSAKRYKPSHLVASSKHEKIDIIVRLRPWYDSRVVNYESHVLITSSPANLQRLARDRENEKNAEKMRIRVSNLINRLESIPSDKIDEVYKKSIKKYFDRLNKEDQLAEKKEQEKSDLLNQIKKMQEDADPNSNAKREQVDAEDEANKIKIISAPQNPDGWYIFIKKNIDASEEANSYTPSRDDLWSFIISNNECINVKKPTHGERELSHPEFGALGKEAFNKRYKRYYP